MTRALAADRLDEQGRMRIDLLPLYFRYDAVTGKLFWRERTPDMFQPRKHSAEHQCKKWNSRYANTEALGANSTGYSIGKFAGRTYGAHRVVWALNFKEWPEQVDHINGIRNDNRLGNLRNVNMRENCKNMRRSKANSSGVTGVSWSNEKGKWRSTAFIGGKHKHLGYFAEISDAVIARRSVELSEGYHPNHGGVLA